MEPRHKLSMMPTNWIHTDMLACTNVCKHPTICVDTGDCQCVLLTCVPHERHLIFSSSDSFPSPPPESKGSSLADMMEHISWRSILRPQAASFINADVPFPHIHAVTLSESEHEWNEENGVHKLQSGNCFTTDSELEQAVRLMRVEARDAELTFVPHYQARNDNLEGRYYRAMDTMEGFDALKVIIPFAHDWCPCLYFDWYA